MGAKTGLFGSKAQRRLSTAGVYLILIFLLVIIAAPILFAIFKSTQTSQQVLRYPPMLTIEKNARQNFQQAWRHYGLNQMMLNSAFIAIVGTTGKIITALLGALAFVYFDFPGKQF
mgnify:CR=1 FL=1